MEFEERAKNTSVKESYIEGRLTRYASKLGWWVRKFTSPSRRSEPDRIFIKNGLVFFVEFKAKGKQPTASQREAHKNIRSHGINVEVIDDVVVGKSIIDKYDKEANKREN